MTRRTASIRIALGFTLLEVMFAVMILGVGLIAVASIFPAASHVQQLTIQDIVSQQAALNAEALLKAKGMPLGTMQSPASFATTAADIGHGAGDAFTSYNHTASGTTRPDAGKLRPPILNQYWPLEDRSYPTTIADPTLRQYFWEPIFRKNEKGEWQAFLFVMKKVRGGNPADSVPKVTGLAVSAVGPGFPRRVNATGGRGNDKVSVGDAVVDNFGNLLTCVGTEPAGARQWIDLNANVDPDIKWLWVAECEFFNRNNRGRSSNLRVIAVGGDLTK